MAEARYNHPKGKTYFYIVMNASISETGSNYHKVYWELKLRYSKLSVNAFNFNWWVNDQSGTASHSAIKVTTNGEHWATIGSGTVTVWHQDAVNIGFGFSSGIRWKDVSAGGYLAYDPSASNTLYLPQLAIPPTVPTSVSVSGNSGTWVNKDDPKFSASWSGATAGTYTIDAYSVDIAKYGQGNYTNTGNVETSQTYGSVSNRPINVLGALSGGDKLQVRIGLHTTTGGDNGWWGHIYWGGTLNVYSSPIAPSTFSVPSSVEIGSNLTISWSGAKRRKQWNCRI